MLDLYFIRHAESEGNLEYAQRVGGRSNHVPLSDKGRTQASLLGLRLSITRPPDHIWSSPALRCVQTAEIACRRAEIPLERILYSDDLQELSQGEWEGKSREEMYTPEILAQINSNPWGFKAPGGESQREVEERMYGWIQQTYGQSMLFEKEPDLKAAIFTHGMAIKCLTRKILNYPPNQTYHTVLYNTSITRFQYEQGIWRLVSFNDSG